MAIRIRSLLYAGIILIQTLGYSQSIPLNNVYFTDLARQNQLIQGTTKNFSFSASAVSFDNDVKNDSSFFNDIYKTIFNSKNGIVQFGLLPVISSSVVNSTYAYGGNNTAMLSNRGINSMLSFGFNAKIALLDIQFLPELTYAQNRPYQVFPEQYSAQLWRTYYGQFLNRMDAPDFQGNPNMSSAFWGQSHIALRYKGSEVAISTENIKTGPARINPLLMGINAPGFLHYRIASYRPVDVKIGTIEYNLAIGTLKGSNQPPIFNDSTHFRFWRPYDTDPRLFTLINFVYSPSFLSGLSIGFTRAVQTYGDNIGFDYFDSFTGFFRNDGLYDDAEQLASFYARWYFTKAKAEWYIEWARNDASYNLLDFLMAPEHSQAYTIGFQKFIEPGKHRFIFSVERTRLERSGMYIFRAEPPYYANGNLRHGHTQNGQFIANSIGPGSNSTTLEISKWNQWNQIGILLAHVTYNKDYHTFAFGNQANRNWTEWTYGVTAKHRFNHFILDSRILHNFSRNYQWQVIENPNRPEFQNPVNKSNLHISANLIYAF